MVTETFSYFYFLNLALWISVKHYIELVRNQTSRKKHRHVHILKTCLFSNFTDVWYCLVNKDHTWTKVNFSSKRQSQNKGEWLLSGEGPQLQLLKVPMSSMVNMIVFRGKYLESNQKYVIEKGFLGNFSHAIKGWIVATVLCMLTGQSKFGNDI